MHMSVCSPQGTLSVTTRKHLTPPRRMPSFQRGNLCSSVANSTPCDAFDRVTEELAVSFFSLLKHLCDGFGLASYPSLNHTDCLRTGRLVDVGREARSRSRRRACAQLRLHAAPLCPRSLLCR